MKKIISQSIVMILLCVALPKVAYSQVNWDADCSHEKKPFTVKFTKSMAKLTLNGWEYEIPFIEYWVDNNGRHWSEYLNKNLRISTIYPQERMVLIFSNSTSSPPHHIANGVCK